MPLEPGVRGAARKIQIAENVLECRFIIRRQGGLDASVDHTHCASKTRLSRPPTSGSAGLFLGNGGLGGGQTGDGDTKRRTTDVIQPDLVAEHDAGRVAAMLPADSNLQFFASLASSRNPDFHQAPDPVLVDGLERVAADHVMLAVVLDE